jgi:hypothetical protein
MHSEYESHEGNITFHVCPRLLWLSHNLTLYWLSYTLLYIGKNSLPKDQTSATFPNKEGIILVISKEITTFAALF